MNGGFHYPVDLIPDDNNAVMARFADFPGVTFGDDADDALARSVDLLETILISYIDDRRDIPAPRPPRDARWSARPCSAR